MFADAWRARYGTEPSPDFPELASFLEHRSVRKFSEQAVPEELISALIACAQSAATSSNLQLWSVISIQDPVRRAAISKLCADQSQVLNAPWFLTFFADHNRLREAALAVGEKTAGLDYTEFFSMALIDVALAAERLVCAAESVGLGICYIGALRNDPDGVKDLLNLPTGTFGAFGLCIGYPDASAKTEIKPRLPQDSIWFRETYPSETSLGDYDERMREFYESQGMKGEVTWSMRSGKRADGNHMTGREVLKDWLEKQGFLRR